jgi:hypothetical protein
VLDAATDAATKRSYASQIQGVNGYETVMKGLNWDKALWWPASIASVEAWIGWLHMAGVASAGKYLSGLRSAHAAKNLPFMAKPQEQEKLRLLRAGAAVVLPLAPGAERPAKRKFFSFTPYHLRLVCEEQSLRASYDGRLFLAAAAVMTYNGNRGGEVLPRGSKPQATRVSSNLAVSALAFDDPSLGSEGMTITYPPRKTDKSRPFPLWLPHLVGDFTSPVARLKAHLADRHKAAPSEPLFKEKSNLAKHCESQPCFA